MFLSYSYQVLIAQEKDKKKKEKKKGGSIKYDKLKKHVVMLAEELKKDPKKFKQVITRSDNRPVMMNGRR